jgi:hypothetical protein
MTMSTLCAYNLQAKIEGKGCKAVTFSTALRQDSNFVQGCHASSLLVPKVLVIVSIVQSLAWVFTLNTWGRLAKLGQ